MEKALQAHEDSLWYLRQIWQTQGKDSNCLPEPGALREALTNGDWTAVNVILAMLWTYFKEELGKDTGLASILFYTAMDIADWVRNSRRVYSLSPSLAEMLLATDLPKFKARDVKFVSLVFAIKLEEPVTTPSGKVHDYIVFRYLPAGEDGLTEIVMRSYSGEMDTYQRVSADKKKRIERLARNNPAGFVQHSSPCIGELNKATYTGLAFTCPVDIPLNEMMTAQVFGEDTPVEDREVLFRLCFGLNLYLQSSRKDDYEAKRTNRAWPNERGKPVTDQTDIFDLNVSTVFHRKSHSLEDEETCRSGGYEMRPHLRNGHWRRPWGYGKDPDAPATVWIKPLWVRKDLIAKGVQPIGALRKVAKR
ncbi:MAG: hypothetical protein WCV68_00420 [Candidatus Paceibacterota bacterium]